MSHALSEWRGFLTAEVGVIGLKRRRDTMYKFIQRAVVVFLATLFVSAAWGAGTKEAYMAEIDGSGVQKVSMDAGSYYFKPDHIVVKANFPVEITIKRESGFIPHDIVLHAPEGGDRLQNGSQHGAEGHHVHADEGRHISVLLQQEVSVLDAPGKGHGRGGSWRSSSKSSHEASGSAEIMLVASPKV